MLFGRPSVEIHSLVSFAASATWNLVPLRCVDAMRKGIKSLRLYMSLIAQAVLMPITSEAGALAMIAATRPREKTGEADPNARRMTGATPSVSLKYAGQGDQGDVDTSARAAALLNRITSQRLYAKEFATSKELGLLDSGQNPLSI